MEKYYITTTAPYVNADPHIGFALEIIQADVLARFQKLNGSEVFFNTGTDEHGKKIYEKAQEEKVEVKAYVDRYAAKFRELKERLGLDEGLHFSRTTDETHIEAAQEMWRRVDAGGYIRKGIYQAKYCVGCELEKQESELVDGRCPLHPNKELEYIEEENYFFCFSKLQKQLLAHYDRYTDFVIPSNRQKEIRNFVESGLADFSISRLKEKMSWGVPVPGDPKQVMYVWFDALTYYISALGFPREEQRFKEFWGTSEKPNAVQVAGKDNLRQQAAMWQAMLMAAGLPPSRQILIHGFIISNGTKMSKSLGNVVEPGEYIEKYGSDSLRYYLLAKMHPTEDSDFTKEKFEKEYQADLQNGLGNLVSRVAAMCGGETFEEMKSGMKVSEEIEKALSEYRFDLAMQSIWERVRRADQLISERKVWELKGEERSESLATLVAQIREIAVDLAPFMPASAERIQTHFQGSTIGKIAPLFPRLT